MFCNGARSQDLKGKNLTVDRVAGDAVSSSVPQISPRFINAPFATVREVGNTLVSLSNLKNKNSPPNSFCTLFNSGRGDILFGLNGIINNYLNEYAQFYVDQSIADSKATWNEDYACCAFDNGGINDQVFEYDGITDPNEYLNYICRNNNIFSEKFHRFVTNPDLLELNTLSEDSVGFDLDVANKDFSQKKFFAFMQDTKYAVSSKMKFTNKQLKKSNESFVVHQDRNLIIDDVLHYLLRRTCKAVLLYILTKTKGHIHFFLDSLNMQDVVSKTKFPFRNGYKAVPVTTTELRFLHRILPGLDSEKQSRVHFYCKNQIVDWPWRNNEVAWLNSRK